MLKIRWDGISHIANFLSDVHYAEVLSETHRFFRVSIEIFVAIAATELHVFLWQSIYSDSALHTAVAFSDI